MGVALGGANEALDALIQRTDEVMYAAERDGRNRVCKAQPGCRGIRPHG
jgi:PleD family two-component response regulator